MTSATPDTKSPFLNFVAAEFRRRGSQHRRDLSNKTFVHQLLSEKTLGGERIGLPQQYAVLTSTAQITAELLGERIALKFANGWSAKGVMLLERLGDDRYYDHMASREWTLEGIRGKQDAVAAKFPGKKAEWIVEELLRGMQPGAVPFDYKFYMFQGQIGMVAQIDRNFSPPRMVKLDGDLKPFVPGRDYKFRPTDIQPGVPVVPRSAVMLSRWAIELAKMTDAPFVRVDLYDTEDGPYFGEFTFSSGAEFKKTVTYSDEVLDYFDALFADAERTLRGEAVEPPQNWSTLLQSTNAEVLASHPRISPARYQRIADFLYTRGSLGGFRLARAQEKLLEEGGDAAVNEYLAQAHKSAGRRALARRPQIPSALHKVTRRVKRRLRK
ncbi:ATP-grasp fold amidoligase family protein [Nesterenkonia aurantiaca]|uniref:ATP-grasp fold amidoligase family protein n=1 Tax=Nesterenkonia aurantiaca TaxID=1436010 RepID=UPI003EE7984F